jgi:putative PIN family toxin of toxin-antitoxin system
MRVLFDTNILVSYVLTGNQEGATWQALSKVIEQEITLLLPGDLFEELVHKVTTKPYLAGHTTVREMEELVTTLVSVSEVLPSINAPFPQIVRDRKDDYLIAYAVVGRADFLVSRDKDLLTLGEVESVRIVSPVEFVQVLDGKMPSRK